MPIATERTYTTPTERMAMRALWIARSDASMILTNALSRGCA
jgi:hypothetical protein